MFIFLFVWQIHWLVLFFPIFFKIPELRKKSRIDYLKKRVVDKVEELDDDIRDWDYLFEGVK